MKSEQEIRLRLKEVIETEDLNEEWKVEQAKILVWVLDWKEEPAPLEMPTPLFELPAQATTEEDDLPF